MRDMICAYIVAYYLNCISSASMQVRLDRIINRSSRVCCSRSASCGSISQPGNFLIKLKLYIQLTSTSDLCTVKMHCEKVMQKIKNKADVWNRYERLLPVYVFASKSSFAVNPGNNLSLVKERDLAY